MRELTRELGDARAHSSSLAGFQVQVALPARGLSVTVIVTVIFRPAPPRGSPAAPAGRG